MGANKFRLDFGMDEEKFKNTTIKKIKEKLIQEQIFNNLSEGILI